MNTDLGHSYTDMAGNTRYSEPCSVAHYVILFFESGIIATVQEHDTMPVLRGDYWLTMPDGTRVNRSITDLSK